MTWAFGLLGYWMVLLAPQGATDEPPPANSRYGLRFRESYDPSDKGRPTVCLVHGMNSSSGSFVYMIPLLEAEGFGVVVYDYPYSRDLDDSVERFARDWNEFRARTGDRRPWVILTHSMGALLARWYVEGPRYQNDVSDLVLIAPPNHGSSIAELQGLLDLIDAVQRSSDKAGKGKIGGGIFDVDMGDAAQDLVPNSAFLKQLNSRPRRDGVRYHILAGNKGFVDAETRRKVESRLDLTRRAGGVLGGLSRIFQSSTARVLDEVSDGTGDGCVAVESTRLEGVDARDQVTIGADHVAIIRGPLLFHEPGPVPCMPQVLEWLRPLKAEPPVKP